MNCPHCGSEKSSVKDSRKAVNGWKRNRLCDDCGQKYTTLEINAIKINQTLVPQYNGMERLLRDAAKFRAIQDMLLEPS